MIPARVHGHIIWPEGLSDNYTAVVFVYYNIGNKEIVDVNVRLNLCKMFSRKDVRHTVVSEFLQRHFKTGPPLVVFMWLASVKEKKEVCM